MLSANDIHFPYLSEQFTFLLLASASVLHENQTDAIFSSATVLELEDTPFHHLQTPSVTLIPCAPLRRRSP